MHILLILPDGNIHRLGFGSWRRSMREAPLTLTTLAALAPPELDIGFTVVDENVEPIPWHAVPDLVGISVMTGTAPRAYEIARHFRQQGIPVAMGGVHATVVPEEVKRFADHLFIGDGDVTWPRFLRDFAAGHAAAVYHANATPDPELHLPIPRRHLQRHWRYNLPCTVMATRGCRQACHFCSVPAIWKGYRRRPVGDVVADIRSFGNRRFAFNDVSLVDDVDYAKELFRAIIPLRREWGGLATVKVADDPELLELMARSGCRYLLIGFESLNQAALGEIRKVMNHEDRYHTLMSRLHEAGISVQGCFMFGFDHDDATVFDATVARIDELGIDIPRFSILTPYPGTALFRRLSAEVRILTCDWSNYDTMHVVFRPRQMSPEELYTGFKRAYREAFTLGRIQRRIRHPNLTGLINALGNLTYRRFAGRLRNEERYRLPYADAVDPYGKDVAILSTVGDEHLPSRVIS